MNPILYRYAYHPLNSAASVLHLKDAARMMLRAAPNGVRRRAEGFAEWCRVRAAYNRPLVPADDLRLSFLSALRRLQSRGQLGDDDVYLEFGVCHGTSLRCFIRACREAGVRQLRIFGFDSFEGLPPSADEDDGGNWMAGSFKAHLDYTRARIDRGGADWTRTHLIKGWFSETLTDELVARHDPRPARIILVDADTYLSTRESLAFAAPLIADEAIVYFDDWHSAQLAEKNLGEKRAFDEFLVTHPEFRAERLPALRYHDNSEVYQLSRV